MTQICSKCFRPKHTLTEWDKGIDLVGCVEMPDNEMIFTDQYSCGCCKCAKSADIADTHKPTFEGFRGNIFSTK